MAELLVRIADKVPADDPRARLFLRAGEVVVVCPDGWTWSAAEQTNPHWKIIKLPKVTVSEASAMLGDVKAIPGSGYLPLRRAFYFETVPLATLDSIKANATWTDLDAARTARTVPRDPAVLGDPPHIIG